MPQQDPSRTEQATPKRRKKARDEGQVPKSADLTKAVLLIIALISMRLFVGNIGTHLAALIQHYCGRGMFLELNQVTAYNLFLGLSVELGAMLLPIMLVMAVTSYVVLRLQVGDLWAPKVFEFKLPNLNPFAGLRRMLDLRQAAIRLGKEAIQAVGVGAAIYIVLRQEWDNILPLFYQNVPDMLTYILETAFRMVKYAVIPMLIIGVADLLYTRWDYDENLKMTKDEVKDEVKQAEGDPIIKTQQRQKMFAFMQKRMLKNVPKADVVITNPTHIAVALSYDPFKAPAPIVLAKGADHMAEKIKDIAREHSIPIRENKPLARALYKSVEVGDTIPEDLYQAVAAILAQLQRFKQSRKIYG